MGRRGEKAFYDFSLPLAARKFSTMKSVTHEMRSIFSWRTCWKEAVEQGSSQAAKVFKEGEVYQ